MIEAIFTFSRYFVALLFGTLIACRLVGWHYTKKSTAVLALFIACVFFIQLLCLNKLGFEQTIQLYPLICHVPIMLFLALYLKKSWLISVTSMIITFLCCQPLRWVGTLLGEIFQSATMNHVGYICTAALLYYIMEKYACEPIYHLMIHSVRSCLLLAAMPTFYYIFDYATVVYTDFMYRGEHIAIQFMPFITATFYLLFILLYYAELKKQFYTKRHLDLVQAQFKHAQNEYASLKHMQQQATHYRHDMRHHFSLLQGLASTGDLDGIQQYLRTAQTDLQAITPNRYCENDTVNLLLAAFAAKAKTHDITLTLKADIAEQLPFSNTELCSLLSNAFENAMQACCRLENKAQRIITLRLFTKNNKLCIDLRNSYAAAPRFAHGLPITSAPAHGFGTKSMVHIIEKYGGLYQFSLKEGLFVFQATV